MYIFIVHVHKHKHNHTHTSIDFYALKCFSSKYRLLDTHICVQSFDDELSFKHSSLFFYCSNYISLIQKLMHDFYMQNEERKKNCYTDTLLRNLFNNSMERWSFHL